MKELKLTIRAKTASRIANALEDVALGVDCGEVGDFSSDFDGFHLEYEIRDVPETPKKEQP